jgi:tetratricopeptide (TPR) repeat protein
LSEIQIQILVGVNKGKRLRGRQGPITFGRADDNSLVLDQEHVSRYHGELELADDQWWLHNHSPNPTFVGKKKVGKKPRLLQDQDVVALGDQPLFQVVLDTGAAVATPNTGADDGAKARNKTTAAPTEQTGGSGRRKLWTVIGIYLAAMLGLFIFLATLSDEQANNTTLTPLTQSTIAQEIRQLGPSPDAMAPSARQAQQYVQRATETFNMRGSQRDALYQAHLYYQRAQAHSPDGMLADGSDQARAMKVEEMLIGQVQQQYSRALALFRDQRYDRALETFRDLKRLYPATDRQRQSTIFQNAEQYIAQARQRLTASS